MVNMMMLKMNTASQSNSNELDIGLILFGGDARDGQTWGVDFGICLQIQVWPNEGKMIFAYINDANSPHSTPTC